MCTILVSLSDFSVEIGERISGMMFYIMEVLE